MLTIAQSLFTRAWAMGLTWPVPGKNKVQKRTLALSENQRQNNH
jgi:hypothetical protein